MEQEYARKAEDLKIVDDLKKELDTLVASIKQLHTDNETLRKEIANRVEQLKTTEQRVTDRFADKLKASFEELQKETVKTTSLTTLINTLKDSDGTSKKELEKLRKENRLMSVKYDDQTSEHAAAFKVCHHSHKACQSSENLLH